MLKMYSYGTSVLFVCRVCKSSFEIVDDFIEHKKEEHSVEFQTYNCIVFEDILITNANNDEECDRSGMLSTVTIEKEKKVPPNDLADVDLSNGTEPIPQEPADSFDPFPKTTSDSATYLKCESQETTSYEDHDETWEHFLQENHEDQETVNSSLASTEIRFNFIEPKTEWIEFESGQEIQSTDIVERIQFPQNPYVLLKKLSCEKIQSYSRLRRNQDTLTIKTEGTFKSRCKGCRKKFNSEAELEIHRRVCIVDKSSEHLHCSPCRMFFRTKWLLQSHNLRRHRTEKEERSSGVQCNVCGRKYCRKNALRRHMTSHQDAQNNPFKCDQCSATLSSQYYLTRHEASHSLVRPFKCTEPGCKKKFKREDHLTQHLKLVHCGETRRAKGSLPTQKSFSCDLCSASFFYKSQLAQHQVKHSAARPFQCPEIGCEKSFQRKCILKMHLKCVHSNRAIQVSGAKLFQYTVI